MAEFEKKQEGGEKPLLHPEKPSSGGPVKAFAFWCYCTVAVSLITLMFISIPRIGLMDERSWYLNLPDGLRRHHSAGKLIKVIPPSNSGEQMQVFAVDLGKKDAETVLLVHGLGCSSYSFRHVIHSLVAGGLRAVAVDVPGSGFSDDLSLVHNMEYGDLFGWAWSIFAEIKEKGIFWGFDQLIETGEIQEKSAGLSGSERSDYESGKMGAILGQVVDSMALAPVHLVLHDSALLAGMNWASANPGLVRSLTLIDASPNSAAFPCPLLRLPFLGHLILGSKTLFTGILRLCCARSVDRVDAEVYRLLLKKKNRKSAVLASWRALNQSLDLGEWVNSEVLKGLPVLVLWSNTLTDQWIDEGRRVAASIPRAKFFFHSGGRWPQEDAAEEISWMITNFVSSLPKSIRPIEEDTESDHIQKMFEEGSHQNGHHHHEHNYDHHHDHHPNHHHHGHHHELNHGIGYIGMYDHGHGALEFDY